MTATAEPRTVRPQVPLLLTAVFLVYLGQLTLNPIIAPLSREVRLAEWQIGVTISVAAVMLVLTSQYWGRRSQSWGRAWDGQPRIRTAVGDEAWHAGTATPSAARRG